MVTPSFRRRCHRDQCWDGPQGTGTTDSSGLLDMGLQVAAATGVEYPLGFCLTHVGVVLN